VFDLEVGIYVFHVQILHPVQPTKFTVVIPVPAHL